MNRNMGTTDRVIRILLAVAFAVLYFTNLVSGTPGIILLIVSGMFLATTFIGVCPLYMISGFSTRKIVK